MSKKKSSIREYVWQAADRDWRKADMLTAGVDVGSTTSKAVILSDGALLSYSILWSGADKPDSARKALEAALKNTGVFRNDIHYVVGTGSGEANFSVVNRTVSEISCHARGANHSIGGSVRTVLVLGGRDCTVIHCNDGGQATAFLTNACSPSYCRENPCNACGAAQGNGLDVVADYLGVPVEDIGAISLTVADKKLEERLALPLDKRARVHDTVLEEINQEPVTGGHLLDGGSPPLGGALSVVCDVMAKSQTSALLRNEWSKEEILAVYCAALAHQAAMLVKRIGIEDDFVVVGGVAKNIGVVRRLEKELGVRAIVMKPDPQLSAALGAALFAGDFWEKARKTA
jgi:activator of 2-hydroxyglutaryl-CoA dehydratase